jgi:hypothetical protein
MFVKKKVCRLGGQQVVLQMNEDFDPYRAWQKIHLQVRLKLHGKQSTKRETMANIQDKPMTKLWNDHAKYHMGVGIVQTV